MIWVACHWIEKGKKGRIFYKFGGRSVKKKRKRFEVPAQLAYSKLVGP
jgi:hypothetical protein